MSGVKLDTAGAENAMSAQIDRVKNLGKGVPREKIREVAEDFESVFLGQMVREMFKGVPIGRFGGGYGEKVWREHLYGEYGKAIAKAGGVGIADSVEREILRMNGEEALGGRYQTGDSAEIRGRALKAYTTMPAGAPNLVEPLPSTVVGVPPAGRGRSG